MIAYKLVRKLKSGKLSPLFINKKSRLSINKWMNCEAVPTKGFSYRVGWHCLLKPEAPHLSKKGRVWVQVEIDGYESFKRPVSQGGEWVLAKRMKIVKELNIKT